MGDVHGAYKAIVQCMSRAGFDYERDKLIFLGDVADGWPDVPECIEEFLKIKNLIALKGNHDLWLEEYLKYGDAPEHWLMQGGIISVQSYKGKELLISRHLKFLEDALPYYLDENRRLFIHAGFNPAGKVEDTDVPDEDYYWSREVFRQSFAGPIQPGHYSEIFIGHTPTHGISYEPVNNFNVWLLDQGAAWDGYLTLMNVDTKRYVQSDRIRDLYPNDPGRAGLIYPAT